MEDVQKKREFESGNSIELWKDHRPALLKMAPGGFWPYV